MGAALLLFYTSLTMVDVPHSALGAELSDSYHDRTRIFGVKRVFFGIGTLGAVASIAAFDSAADVRFTGRVVGAVAAPLAIALVVYMTLRVRERPEYQGRGATSPLAALRDILSNPHARLLLAVFLIQQLGIVALTASMPFFSQYVLGTPEYTFVYIGLLFITSIAGVPFWLRFAPHYEKRNLLMISMAMVAVVIGLLFFAREGDVLFVCAISIVGGLASPRPGRCHPHLRIVPAPVANSPQPREPYLGPGQRSGRVPGPSKGRLTDRRSHCPAPAPPARAQNGRGPLRSRTPRVPGSRRPPNSAQAFLSR